MDKIINYKQKKKKVLSLMEECHPKAVSKNYINVKLGMAWKDIGFVLHVLEMEEAVIKIPTITVPFYILRKTDL